MASNNVYEMQREKNMHEKHQMMVQLGLLKPVPKQTIHTSTSSRELAIRKNCSEHSATLSARRTVRQSLTDSDDFDDGDGGGGGVVGDDDDDNSLNNGYESSSGCSEISIEKPPPIKHNVYGSIEGVEVGDWWLTSRECWQSGVHRPPAVGAPVHCGPDGAYSVSLSDNLSDGDVDGGERFSLSAGGAVHTGSAGLPQQQQLSYDTVALVASMKSKKPVRVIRAHKLASAYAPDIGYRYDGVYDVANYWVATSKEGATVYKFLLQRSNSSGQPPPPWLVHKILPPTLHRTVRAKIARALQATAARSKNARQDTLKASTTTSTAKWNGKNRRKVTSSGTVAVAGSVATSDWTGGTNLGLASVVVQKQSFEQLLKHSSTSPTKNALRMQASSSSSRNNQQQPKAIKKKGITKLFENYPFHQQQQQQLVLIRNQQLTPEPDPADMLFEDDLSYLSLKKKSYQESLASGQAATGSFEAEFVKICDELCSELPERGGLVWTELPQHARIGCNELQRGVPQHGGLAYNEVAQHGGLGCSEVPQRSGLGCSRLLQHGSERVDNCSKLLQHSNVAYSELPQHSNVEYSEFTQRGSVEYSEHGDPCSKMPQHSNVYSKMPHNNKRIKYSSDSSNNNNYAQSEEFVSVSRNRRKSTKVLQKSAIVQTGEVVNGEKKTSIFDQTIPHPTICYKSANDFLNSLVGTRLSGKDGRGNEEVEEEGKESVGVEGEKAEVMGGKPEVVQDGFLGFNAQEVYASKEYSTRFADFLFKLCEHTDEIHWTGWGVVPRRSIIVNGFLIEQVQRENQSENSEQIIVELDDSD